MLFLSDKSAYISMMSRFIYIIILLAYIKFSLFCSTSALDQSEREREKKKRERERKQKYDINCLYLKHANDRRMHLEILLLIFSLNIYNTRHDNITSFK